MLTTQPIGTDQPRVGSIVHVWARSADGVEYLWARAAVLKTEPTGRRLHLAMPHKDVTFVSAGVGWVLAEEAEDSKRRAPAMRVDIRAEGADGVSAAEAHLRAPDSRAPRSISGGGG